MTRHDPGAPVARGRAPGPHLWCLMLLPPCRGEATWRRSSTYRLPQMSKPDVTVYSADVRDGVSFAISMKPRAPTPAERAGLGRSTGRP